MLADPPRAVEVSCLPALDPGADRRGRLGAGDPRRADRRRAPAAGRRPHRRRPARNRRHRGPANGRGSRGCRRPAGRPSPRWSRSGSPRKKRRPRARTTRKRARRRSRAGRIRRPRRRLPMVADVASLPRVIVGLGNPGRGVSRHAAQPGRAGGGRSWRCSGRALPAGRPPQVADVAWHGEPLYLIKPVSLHERQRARAGAAPPALHPARNTWSSSSTTSTCPWGRSVSGRGAARGAPRGGSVMGALGTEEVRRVKIGVGRPATRGRSGGPGALALFRDEERAAWRACASGRRRGASSWPAAARPEKRPAGGLECDSARGPVL